VRLETDAAIEAAFLKALEVAGEAAEIERLPDDLKEVAQEFKRQLEAQRVAAETGGKAVLAAALKAIIDALPAGAHLASERLKGFIYAEVAARLDPLISQAKAVEEAVKGGLGDLGKSFAVALRPFVSGLVNFVRASAAARAFDSMCNLAASALIDVIMAVAPTPSGPNQCTPATTAACVTGGPAAANDSDPILPPEICRELVRLRNVLECLRDRVQQAIPGLPPDLQAVLIGIAQKLRTFQDDLKARGELLSKQIIALDTAVAALMTAASDLDKLRAAVCSAFDSGTPPDLSKLPDLPLAAFRDIVRARVALTEELVELGKSITTRTADMMQWTEVLLGPPPGPAPAGPPSVVPAPSLQLREAVRDSVAAMAGLAWGLLRLSSEVTALATQLAGAGQAARQNALNAVDAVRTQIESATNHLDADLRALILEKLQRGLAEIRQGVAEVAPKVQAGRQASIALRTMTETDAAGIRAKAALVKTQLDGLPALVDEIKKKVVGEFVDSAGQVQRQAEAKLLSWAAAGIGASAVLADAVFAQMVPLLQPLLKSLSSLYESIGDLRDRIYQSLAPDGTAAPPGATDLEQIAGGLLGGVRSSLAQLLIVPDGSNVGIGNDLLAAERKLIKTLADQAVTSPDDLKRALDGLGSIVSRWNDDSSALQQLARRLASAGSLILQGDLARLVDLGGLRRRIEARLQELIPSKLKLSYDFNGTLKDFKIFIPEGRKRLNIRARAEVDLLKVGQAPRFTVNAFIDPFTINLLKGLVDLDIVSLKFRGARFSSGGEKGSDFRVDFADVELGEAVKFLKDIQSYLRPRDGSGPYVTAMARRPGIEAGYSLNLGTISIGTVSFINVSLNAGCELPFDRSDALFKVGIGRRGAPFLISAAPYGGGGFFSIFANGRGIVGFEASFEFGGVAAFSFGPLDGVGRITLGIYCRQGQAAGDKCIEGFFFAGGAARIACFGIAASLSVSMSQQGGGSMEGSATFSFSFSIGLTDFTYEVDVWRSEGPGFSASAALDPPTRFAGPVTAAVQTRVKTKNVLQNLADDQSRWDVYQQYFDNSFQGSAA
jgi:hypothetical protein